MKNKLLLLPIIMVFLAGIANGSMLQIDDVTIYYGDSQQRGIPNSGEYNEAIEPGDDIEVEVEVRNIFRDNVDIEDIEVVLRIANISENDDVEEDASKFDLDYGDKRAKRISIEIPDDAEELRKKLEVLVSGVDENKTVHKAEWAVYLKIENEKHNVNIYSTRLKPEAIDCRGEAELVVWIENSGNYDEENVVLEVKNEGLGIYKRYEGLDIDEDEKYTKVIPLILSNITKTGKFPLELKVYYKGDHLDDIEAVELQANACKIEDHAAADSGSQISEQSGEESGEKGGEEQDVVVEPKESLKTKPKDNNFILIGSMLLAALTIIFVIIMLVILLVKK